MEADAQLALNRLHKTEFQGRMLCIGKYIYICVVGHFYKQYIFIYIYAGSRCVLDRINIRYHDDIYILSMMKNIRDKMMMRRLCKG
jgi:hypothetical protein